MKQYLLPIFSGIFLSVCSMNAQTETRIITNDSLEGFNEQLYRDAAKYKGIIAEEMDIYLSYSRRDFIKTKYNLYVSVPEKYIIPENYSAKTSTAACNNEDFEAFSSSYSIPSTINITTISGIPGWTSTSGTNSGSQGSCQLSTCCSAAPNAIQVIAPGAGGLIDPIIGAAYPIHSVFGNNLNTLATTINGFNCYGDWFAKVNNSTGGAGLSRLTKTLTVSPSNVIFNFAYIAVVQGAHCCCDNGGVSIKFRDCLGNLLASASQFSISPVAGVGCSPTGTCSSPSTITVVSSSVSAGWYYNKWVNSSIDLSLWLGSCITIEVTGIDCPYAGHGGYAYFDGQCASTVVNDIHINYINAGVNLYPNPTSGNFTLEIAREILNGEVEIRNVLGQLILLEKINKGANKLETPGLAKGIYTYNVLEDKKILNTGKLIIE